MKKQLGAATLVMSLILIMVSTIIILFAANYGVMQSKSIANLNRNYQAYEAAQAGMEYAINYLNKNSATILANPSGGYIQAFSNSNTTNVVLGNNSSYSFTYTNPVANNYQLIKITSTGTSNDSSATRTVTQLVQFGSGLAKIPSRPLITLNSISLGSGSTIQNLSNNNTIATSSSVSLNGTASTVLSSGVSSSSGNIKSDISQSDATLNSTSPNDLFSSYFGTNTSLAQSVANTVINNSSSAFYHDRLDEKTGQFIWINQTGGLAILNGDTTVGNSSNPVLLVVNGNNLFFGNVTIYGFLFVMGNNIVALGSNIQINGGFMTTGTISGSGALQINYSPTILNNLQTQQGIQYYAKIPGSWKDF